MINYSAISKLKTFSVEEVRLFEDFLNSPFHNKNEKVIRLFGILKRYHPSYDDKNLSRESLFREMLGNKKFREFHIRNLFSDLNILTEKFLQQIYMKRNYVQEKLLIEELIRRNIKDAMEKKIRLFEKKVNSQKSKDHDYYTNKVFVYEAKSFLTVDKTLTDSFRKEQLLNTIKLFLITIMEFYFYLIVEEQRVRIKHNFDFLNLILDYLKDHIDEYRESPLLMVYYFLLMSFFEKKTDEKYFFKSREIFKKNESSLSKVDKKNIYSLLQAFCMNKIDSGVFSYNRELLNILLEMLRTKILSHKEKDIIDINLFRNIIVLSVTLKETSMLKKIIRENLNLVDTESRSSMSAYSYAHLNFLQKNYEKSLELCNKINFSDLLVTTNENLYFKSDIKKMMLMCLYELGSFESAMSLIDTYKHFLNNSRLIKEGTREKYRNFLNLVNELIKLRLKSDEFSLVKLMNKVLHCKAMVGKDWLLEKLGEKVKV